jgi:hypothetical protein
VQVEEVTQGFSMARWRPAAAVLGEHGCGPRAANGFTETLQEGGMPPRILILVGLLLAPLAVARAHLIDDAAF